MAAVVEGRQPGANVNAVKPAVVSAVEERQPVVGGNAAVPAAGAVEQSGGSAIVRGASEPVEVPGLGASDSARGASEQSQPATRASKSPALAIGLAGLGAMSMVLVGAAVLFGGLWVARRRRQR